MKIRSIEKIINPVGVTEGAGVKLIRSIASPELDHLDPFLLFDHFGSDNPDDYMPGFPMHPHRGIETVTYMLSGKVNHKDSLSNSGSITAGDVQWMTSGGGIMHEEMPEPVDGKMAGFQLWVNLPAKQKMSEPRYQEILSDLIPEVIDNNGIKVRVIAGVYRSVTGPVTDIQIKPSYLDVTISPDATFSFDLPGNHSAFAYVFEGEALIDNQKVGSPKMVIFSDGDQIQIKAGGSTRLLLISGESINEPIARYGPFVMNTQEEIRKALMDLRSGTFVWGAQSK